MQPKRIGFLGFDDITALDLVGPIETFATAVVDDGHGARRPCYAPVTIGVRGRSFRAESGLTFKADTTLPAAPALDTIVIPGGSGLRHQGGRWQTQIYRTADFGNLKPGVGLLLDLGSPHSVSSVRFDAGPGPITVQLRAGDQASSGPASFTATGSSTSAHGPTTLDGMPGSKHRYWLVWISQLAATPGGYSAVVSDPVVHGSS